MGQDEPVWTVAYVASVARRRVDAVHRCCVIMLRLVVCVQLGPRRSTAGQERRIPRYRYPQYEVLLNAGSVLKVLMADTAAIRLEVVDDHGDE